MSEVKSTFRLHPGDPTPAFSLPDADGHLISSHDATGPRGLLIVFACNHCPYVLHLADALGNLARELSPQGIHTVAINSNDTERYPQDGPKFMKPFTAHYGWDFSYLIDESQEIAKAFGAACTPDFFLIDDQNRLFYTGQFDDSRPRSGQEADGADLREAARRMLAGEPPPVRPFPGSGCNIKWRAGDEPAWSG